eukprot:3520269-Amphidinium_carterae.1
MGEQVQSKHTSNKFVDRCTADPNATSCVRALGYAHFIHGTHIVLRPCARACVIDASLLLTIPRTVFDYQPVTLSLELRHVNITFLGFMGALIHFYCCCGLEHWSCEGSRWNGK